MKQYFNHQKNLNNYFIFLFLFIFSIVNLSCSQLQNSTSGFSGDNRISQQNLVDVYPDPFGSRLYEATDYRIEMDVVDNQVINWIAIDQSGLDLSNFAIVSYSFNGRSYELPAISSTSIVEKFTIRPPREGIPTAQRNKLLLTIRYAPSAAVKSVNEPHSVQLIINHDGGVSENVITTRFHLKGYTTGILPGKCNRDPASMEVVEYEFVNNQFSMYLCDKNAPLDTTGLINTDRGERTNVAPVDVEGSLMFYKPDEETICIYGSEKADGELIPTFPDFALPLPQGFSEATDSLPPLPSRIPYGYRAECALDPDTGEFICNNAVALTIFADQVPVNPLTISNVPQFPTSTDCREFGEVPLDDPDFESGFTVQSLGSPEMTLVGFTEILPSGSTQMFSIDGALVVAVIKARLVQ